MSSVFFHLFSPTFSHLQACLSALYPWFYPHVCCVSRSHFHSCVCASSFCFFVTVCFLVTCACVSHALVGGSFFSFLFCRLRSCVGGWYFWAVTWAVLLCLLSAIVFSLSHVGWGVLWVGLERACSVLSPVCCSSLCLFLFPFSRLFLGFLCVFTTNHIRVGCGCSTCWFLLALSLQLFFFFLLFFVFFFVYVSVRACVRSGGARVCIVRRCIRIGK